MEERWKFWGLGKKLLEQFGDREKGRKGVGMIRVKKRRKKGMKNIQVVVLIKYGYKLCVRVEIVNGNLIILYLSNLVEKDVIQYYGEYKSILVVMFKVGGQIF